VGEQAAGRDDRGAAGRRLQHCALCSHLLYVLPEARTGRRSEGVFVAGFFFVEKCTSGIGIFLAGAILAIAGFPEKAIARQAPIDRLTLTFGITYLIIAQLAAPCFSRFPFGRAEHDAGLARLRAELAE
jgi:GPH family glycoside/pentoside/hexuronide:cation symporter